MVELDKFGTFPHPEGTPKKLRTPIVFLVPSPAAYQDDFDTFLHFYELSGGCTGHYLEKGNIAYFLSQNETVGRCISDISIVAGEIDIFIRSQIQKGQDPRYLDEAIERAENQLNGWLREAEVEKAKFRSVHIDLCEVKSPLVNPLRVKQVYYDWGISHKEKAGKKESYYVSNIDLGTDANRIWFLDTKSKSKVKKMLLANKEFQKMPLCDEVEDGKLFPIYISPNFFNSLLIHFWIEFRDSSIKDLIEAVESTAEYGMSREIGPLRDYIFRIMALEGNDAFLSFFVPDLAAFYRVINATHQMYELHRIRSRIVTHSFLLRPPFLCTGEAANGQVGK